MALLYPVQLFPHSLKDNQRRW